MSPSAMVFQLPCKHKYLVSSRKKIPFFFFFTLQRKSFYKFELNMDVLVQGDDLFLPNYLNFVSERHLSRNPTFGLVTSLFYAWFMCFYSLE